MHCKACDASFQPHWREVTGPDGPMQILEDLCFKCRYSIFGTQVYIDDDATVFLESMGVFHGSDQETGY